MTTLSIILSACGGAPEASLPEGSQAVSESPAQPSGDTVLRFIVTSDNHVADTTGITAARLKKLFSTAYAYADKQEYSKIDAFVCVGDMTNNGFENECRAWKSVVDSCIRPETQIFTVMGNHEFYGNGTDAGYTAVIDSELNKHLVINGYHFIGVSTYKEGDYSQSLEWLKDTLKQAHADGKEKPIFTFQHHHIKNTVYTSAEWHAVQSTQLNSLYSKYSNVVNFSGHSHAPINNPASCYQKDYTLFGTGTLAYFEMASGMTYGTIPPNADSAAQYYIVEVTEGNSLRVLPFNLLTEDFFKTPDGSRQLVYEIPSVTDKSTWLYTDARRAEAAAPAFKQGDKPEMSNVTHFGAEISIPQASDDDCVYSYNIVCKSESGKETQFNYFSEYYFEPIPQKLTFKLSGLASGTKYTVSVYPVDVFGKKGEPITAEFTTEQYFAGDYSSENDVNFVGTFTNFDNHTTTPTVSSGNLAYGGTVNGDIYVGTWNSLTHDPNSHFALAENGYNGSAALKVWSDSRDNQGLYIFGTESNKNTLSFPSVRYLRVWVDFSDIEFRKANFGLVAPNGDLYTTDESDYVADLEYYYLPEGETEWQRFVHGADGCFGVEQQTSVKGFKGWMAFPVEDFTYRYGTGAGSGGAGEAYPYNEIAGVYMFWNYSADTASGTPFLLDEIALVDDYTAFDEYTK